MIKAASMFSRSFCFGGSPWRARRAAHRPSTWGQKSAIPLATRFLAGTPDTDLAATKVSRTPRPASGSDSPLHNQSQIHVAKRSIPKIVGAHIVTVQIKTLHLAIFD